MLPTITERQRKVEKKDTGKEAVRERGRESSKSGECGEKVRSNQMQKEILI